MYSILIWREIFLLIGFEARKGFVIYLRWIVFFFLIKNILEKVVSVLMSEQNEEQKEALQRTVTYLSIRHRYRLF